MAYRNAPRLSNESGDNTVRRYTHAEMVIDHNGIKAAIKSNGKVIITQVNEHESTKDEIAFDEVTIPASLIFKLTTLLRATRSIEYVGLSELKQDDMTADPEKV